jgi:hypothetical protein
VPRATGCAPGTPADRRAETEINQHDGERDLVRVALAGQKDFIYAPGEFETHWFADRRTDLYGPLTDAALWPQSPRRAREQRTLSAPVA